MLNTSQHRAASNSPHPARDWQAVGVLQMFVHSVPPYKKWGDGRMDEGKWMDG